MKSFQLIILFFVTSVSAYSQINKEQFSPSGKVIVHVFGNAVYDVDKNRYDYHFTRAHLGYQYQFSSDWSAKIIIDRGRSTSVGPIKVTDPFGTEMEVQNSGEEGAYYSMHLKFASLLWKVNQQLSLETGAILQNHYITQERFWGLRYVAQTFQDKYWKIPSSDLGFIAYYQPSPRLSFDFAFTNGEGPRSKQDEKGRTKVAGGLSFHPSKNMTLRGYYHSQKTIQNDGDHEQMYSLFAAYKAFKKFRIAAEFNAISNWKEALYQKSHGFSLYSVYSMNTKTEYFVRFDRVLYESEMEPNEDSLRDCSYIIAGLSHIPVKKVRFSVNYQGDLSDQTHYKNNHQIQFSMEYQF